MPNGKGLVKSVVGLAGSFKRAISVNRSVAGSVKSSINDDIEVAKQLRGVGDPFRDFEHFQKVMDATDRNKSNMTQWLNNEYDIKKNFNLKRTLGDERPGAIRTAGGLIGDYYTGMTVTGERSVGAAAARIGVTAAGVGTVGFGAHAIIGGKPYKD